MTDVTTHSSQTDSKTSHKKRSLHYYIFVLIFIAGILTILFLLYINGKSIYEHGI